MISRPPNLQGAQDLTSAGDVRGHRCVVETVVRTLGEAFVNGTPKLTP